MPTIQTRDGTDIYYSDWVQETRLYSAMVGLSAVMPSRIRCSSWQSAATVSSRMTAAGMAFRQAVAWK